LRQLLKDPDFVCKFDDIVVEFGNARRQSLADRFIFGESVSAWDVRGVWQDTGQWLTWDSPVYQQFFETVRDDNLHRVCSHKISVLLGDPPIDWSLIKSAADFKPFPDRDGFFASVHPLCNRRGSAFKPAVRGATCDRTFPDLASDFQPNTSPHPARKGLSGFVSQIAAPCEGAK
jgi:hypothetical protein